MYNLILAKSWLRLRCTRAVEGINASVNTGALSLFMILQDQGYYSTQYGYNVYGYSCMNVCYA